MFNIHLVGAVKVVVTYSRAIKYLRLPSRSRRAVAVSFELALKLAFDPLRSAKTVCDTSRVWHTSSKTVFNSRKHVPGVKLETITWLVACELEEAQSKFVQRKIAATTTTTATTTATTKRKVGNGDGVLGLDPIGRRYDFDFRYSESIFFVRRDEIEKQTVNLQIYEW
ncbi:hypothetical protein DBV15_08317 [Temnothorax longispinosus]|uniref:Uncharacterized protein n=1 Tax=Temnothorax longispinosus TaxID=300112 RepID=A0A4S2L652_9HYME|nr:hypothetical protein DBV15_08317 [Temnothorax longispinosus]